MPSNLEIANHLNNIEDRIARPFRNRVFREKNRFIKQQANRRDVLAPISNEDFAEHKKNMEDIFNRYYGITIRTFSQETIKRLKDLENKASFWEFLFMGWVTFRGAKAAQQTAGTTRDDMRSVILQAQQMETGEPRTTIVSRLLKLRGLSAFRADTIARTEVGMAASYANVETAKKISAESGIELLKQWIPAQDERTRFSHASMDGSPPIGLEAKFLVGGERLDRPRDPAGSAGNIINCRCQVIESVKE